MSKRKRYEPVGPFAPPTPSEADQREGLPMAVAGDEQATRESTRPTTQDPDAFSREVAERYRDPQVTRAPRGSGSSTPHGKRASQRRDENRARERPEGYSEVDENGFRRPDAEEDETTPRVNLPRAERVRDLSDEDEVL